MKEDKKKNECKQDYMEHLREKKAKDGRLSKIGKWLRSDSKPLMDLSGLSEKEKAIMMKLILK